METLLLLVLPFLLPPIAFLVVKRWMPSRVGLATGLAFGLIVIPSLFLLSIIVMMLAEAGWFQHGIVYTIVGHLMEAVQVLWWFHQAPWEILASYLGLRTQTTNIVVWTIVYGTIGHLFDRWRNKRRPAEPLTPSRRSALEDP
jgi:hypothetical protein